MPFPPRDAAVVPFKIVSARSDGPIPLELSEYSFTAGSTHIFSDSLWSARADASGEFGRKRTCPPNWFGSRQYEYPFRSINCKVSLIFHHRIRVDVKCPGHVIFKLQHRV